MLKIKKIRYKNFLGAGNKYTEIDLTKAKTTLIIGRNGNGKCLRSGTLLDVEFANPETQKLFEDYIKSQNKHN